MPSMILIADRHNLGHPPVALRRNRDMIIFLRTPLAIGAMVAWAAIPAGAASMPDVVRVNACVASAGEPTQTFVGPFEQRVVQPGLPPMVMVDFSNVSDSSIASVEFGVVSGGKVVAMVRDVGSFAPNAAIMHAYGIAASAVPPSGVRAQCIPLRIRYADGTEWMNPNMPGH